MDTLTRVVILQHPRESAVPIGTARLAELSLRNSRRFVGVRFDTDAELAALLDDPRASAILLYPGANARPLSEVASEEAKTLVVLDGTWSQAEKLLKLNPRIAALPRYVLAPSAPSRYRIRRAPAAELVSTVEAIVEALMTLEGPECAARSALSPFDALVEQQLTFKVERAERRHTRRARLRRRRVPAVPRERAPDLVVAYGEGNAWPRKSEYGQDAEIVHWAAERLSTGERFSAFIAPTNPLAPSFTKHTGLRVDQVLGGEPRAHFNRRWEEFLGDTAIVGVWGYFASETLKRGGGAIPTRLDLRAVARNFLGKRLGEVEHCAQVLGQAVDVPWAEGRTGRRLAALTAIARALFAVDPEDGLATTEFVRRAVETFAPPRIDASL